jgi:ribosomal protein L11 methyltransferase
VAIHPVTTRRWPALSIEFPPSTSAESSLLQELVLAALDDLHPTAVQELDDRWLVFFASAEDRNRAAALSVDALGVIRTEALDVADEDWARRTQQNLAAVQVGRIIIAPPWAATGATGTPSGTDPVTIVIQPSMGFGTGHHATTRLCAALLQRVDLTGRTVLDVGTGSGVLALAARALGARAVIAVDDDPDAIESARANLVLNGVNEGIDLRLGDFRELPALRSEVVIANLTGGLLIRGAEMLACTVVPGGTLIISGATLGEEADVLAALAPWMTLVERLSEDEWLGARLKRIESAG